MSYSNMTTAFAVIFAVLAGAADASAAAARKSGPAYTTRNGRAAAATPAAPSGAAPTAAQMRQDVALALAAEGSANSHRGVLRGGAGRSVRRADGDGEQLNPGYTKPGALVRTANAFAYTDPGNARTHTVEGGAAMITINNAKAQDVGRAPSIQHGPKDTLPPPNPTGGYASGANSITANTGAKTITVSNNNSGAHDNQNGGSGGKKNDDDPFYKGGTGFDPSF